TAIHSRYLIPKASARGFSPSAAFAIMDLVQRSHKRAASGLSVLPMTYTCLFKIIKISLVMAHESGPKSIQNAPTGGPWSVDLSQDPKRETRNVVITNPKSRREVAP